MNIFSIREGFATNSSSSHSVVFWPENEPIPHDKDVDGEFGWSNFTASSPYAKKKYFYQTLKSNLPVSYSDSELEIEMKRAIFKKKYGVDITDRGYVDHQSVITIPKRFGTNELDTEFLEEVRKIMMQDNVVILGGNDNSEGHPLSGIGTPTPLAKLTELPYKIVTRKDGDVWVMFDKDSGRKIRFSFNDTVTKCDKSPTPELVDLKITNYCDKGCDYCYQDSTPAGLHADVSTIYSIVDELAKAKVFEIAVGGGESTKHPEFINILRYIVDKGMVPNFSTRDLEWIKDGSWREIFKLVGGVAFSIEDRREADFIYATMLTNGIDYSTIRNKISFQYILENEYCFRDIVKSCNYYSIPLTLLGFKQVGRAVTSTMPEVKSWMKYVKEFSIKLSVDTCIADRYKDTELKDVPDYLYETIEGKHSMYIDAVESICGPNSFEPDKFVKYDSKDWVKRYLEW